MKIHLLYIVSIHYKDYLKLADRFISTYILNNPGYDHELVLVVNGGDLDDEAKEIFSRVKCSYFNYDNIGWDIGAYIQYAKTCPKDVNALVCFGSKAHFKRPIWLERVVEILDCFGPGYYGMIPNIRPGWIRSTGFAVHPTILKTYPMRVVNREERLEFEDRGHSIIWWTNMLKCKSYLITLSNLYETKQNVPVKGWWNGDYRDILVNG